MSGVLFTPEVIEGVYPGETMDDGRALMKLDLESMRSYYQSIEDAGDREKASWVQVTDLATRTDWLIRPAPCGLGCYCAAVAKPAP